MVVAFHFCCIAGIPTLSFPRGTDMIQAFFIISGFLTYRSYLIRPSLKEYFANRAKRIIPPYAITIIGCALLGLLLTSMSIREYLASTHLLRYLTANLCFLNFVEPTLPGVFQSNPLPAINGALWTIKVELLFYCLLPFVVMLMQRSKATAVLVALYVLSAIYDFAFLLLYNHTGTEIYELLRRQIGGQFMFFFAGMSVWHFYERIMNHWRSILLVAIAIVVADFFTPVVRYVHPLAYALVIIILSVKIKSLRSFNRLPKITYEIFLIHFPIIQMLVALGIVHRAGTVCSAILFIAILLPSAWGLHCITTKK